MLKKICLNCEKEVLLEHIKTTEEIYIKGETITVPVDFYKCSECHEEIENPDAPDELILAYKEYRRRHGMIQPEDIRMVRKKYGLTQNELSSLLGWGGATLSRYENGALQDEAHDKTLHLIMNPENVLTLIEKTPTAVEFSKRSQLIDRLNMLRRDFFYLQYVCSLKNFYEDSYVKDQLDHLNGYQNLDITKLLNAILFFCDGEKSLERSKLNKLLFYADFLHFKRYGISITGAKYSHLNGGPIPESYDYCLTILFYEEKAIIVEEKFYSNYLSEEFIGKKKPDLSIFTKTELEILKRVQEYFKDFNAVKISKFSLKEKAYQATNRGELISYNYARNLRI